MGMDLSNVTEDETRDIRAHYAGLVKQIDHEVGEIIDTLRRNELLENTVIVFVSDHGDHLGDHGIEGKGTFYEAAAHIPLLVSAPGRAEGATCSDLVELRDVTATILTLAGCDLPTYMDAQALPGLDLGGPPARSHIFGMLTKSWMAFDGRYKLCKYSSGEAMLFDLDKDRHEQDNLIVDPGYAESLPPPRRRLDARSDERHGLCDARPHAVALLDVRRRRRRARGLGLALPRLSLGGNRSRASLLSDDPLEEDAAALVGPPGCFTPSAPVCGGRHPTGRPGLAGETPRRPRQPWRGSYRGRISMGSARLRIRGGSD